MEYAADERQRIVEEAARLICEQGIRDYRLAKEKARDSLGMNRRTPLPANSEISEAVIRYQSLFGGESHRHQLRNMREVTCEVMRLCADFEPRLVGAVLSGAASGNEPVELHLFSDPPEAVDVFLSASGIPYAVSDKRIRLHRNRTADIPVCEFAVREVEFQAVIFPYDGLRRAPTCPIMGRPMRRAPLREVEALVV